jgi:hypothetical protein
MNEATYTVSSDDLAAANRLHFLRSFSFRRSVFAIFFSVIAVALLVFGFSEILRPEDFFHVLAAIWGFVGAICLAGWVAIPWQARRSWNQAQKLFTEVNASWDAEKIHFKSERGDVHVRWGSYYRWAADDRSLLLYQDARTFFFVPLRGLPSDARETIMGFIRAARLPER